MLIYQDEATGFWVNTAVHGVNLVRTHPTDACEGRLCDIHNRRGEEPWASWQLNWRGDRGIMEMLDPIDGIGHPTPAQAQYSRSANGGETWVLVHGCNGACAGAYDQVKKWTTT